MPDHVILTEQAAHDAGTQAGTLNAHRAGRARWSLEDRNIAGERTARMLVLGGIYPPECYERCGWGRFPYRRTADGCWEPASDV